MVLVASQAIDVTIFLLTILAGLFGCIGQETL